MEAVGAASAILSIATVGVQCSIKLMTFAGQMKTAPEQITKIAEDVSLNASILQQLGELAKENVGNEPPVSDENESSTDDIKSIRDADTAASKQSIFNVKGLGTVMSLAKNCEEIFNSLDQSLSKASKQLRAKSGNSGKIKLSHAEKFKWPFLLPGMETMRNELRNVKGTLMLMLQVAMLAYSRKLMNQ
ncbi:Glucose-methanol-choline oxidoreductase N-terminal [Penicillium lagena]|uniref:Glucose-methanol-choline oxidoreductase N-terminal n=1 Tax=Penicillium lagena TaxID=94218 RepID=UPI002541103B|nr:Glucose-methanol-choline oxidoreductase N-terminal [Penicillium lagena]KAJ5619371.1 Glucose-methanol-choline oxidoreductase N-terminal [Penicillium lagena]